MLLKTEEEKTKKRNTLSLHFKKHTLINSILKKLVVNTKVV